MTPTGVIGNKGLILKYYIFTIPYVQVFDIDGNGKIELKELQKVMQRLGEKMTDEEIREMIAELDTNQDGVISKDGNNYKLFSLL